MPALSSIALGMAAVGAVAGVAGQISAAGDRAKMLDMHKDAVSKWLDLHVPDPAQQRIILKRYVDTGQLEPQIEEALKVESSNFEKIQQDAGLKTARMRALSSLEDIGNSGGMTMADEANFQKGLIDINSDAKGRTGAVADNFARRGMSGSGFEMAAQMQGAQDANDRMAMAKLDTLGSARNRALQSIVASGNLAGDMADDDYKQQADLAQSRDAIAEFNTRNMQGVAQRNVDRKNSAAEYNLNKSQRLSDMNTGLANEEEKHNKALYQQQFDNQFKKTAGLTGALKGSAEVYGENADRSAKSAAGIGSAINQGGASYMQYASAAPQQTHMKNFDSDSSYKTEDEEEFWASLV